MRKILAMMSIVAVMAVAVQPMTANAAYAETYNLQAEKMRANLYIYDSAGNQVAYEESGWQTVGTENATYRSSEIPSGGSIDAWWLVAYPVDKLTMMKLDVASSLAGSIQNVRYPTNTYLYFGVEPSGITTSELSFDVTFGAMDIYPSGNIVEVFYGSPTTISEDTRTARYITFNNTGVLGGFDIDVAGMNENAGYVYLEIHTEISGVSDVCTWTTGNYLVSSDLTLSAMFDSTEELEFVFNKYNTEVVGQIEHNQNTVINQNQTIINQGNTIITPESADKELSDNMQSEVTDKGNQSDQLLEDSKVDKPTISDDDLNPMDKVDEEALSTMGGVIGAVFVSPTLGSIAVLTLVFGLIGYILHGKR